MGTVLYVEDGYVYTIEGNSVGQAAVQRYSLNNPRTVGYGLLDWAGKTGNHRENSVEIDS